MKEIKLFDYQEDMKERIEKALRLHRSVMAQMPTGTGKTVLLASVVESFLREHSNCNVWIVAHRRELVSQIQETIERVFGDCKEQHNLRFTRVRGLLKNGQNTTLIFACHNLKKMANWRWKKTSNQPLIMSNFIKISKLLKKRGIFLFEHASLSTT